MPPLKAQLLLEESLSANFPESLFNFTGIRTSRLNRSYAESSQPRGFSMQSERRSSLLKEKPQLIWITSTCLKSKSIGSPRLLAAEDLLDTIGETC